MNDELYQQLLHQSWHRPLTSDEKAGLQAYLLSHPQKEEDWEQETALTEALRKLPNAPVSSNFTALVMQAVDAEPLSARSRWQLPWLRWTRSWLPRLSTAGVLLMLGLGGIYQYQNYTRTQASRTAAAFLYSTAAFPSPEILQDFDAIRQYGQLTAGTDADLLAVLER